MANFSPAHITYTPPTDNKHTQTENKQSTQRVIWRFAHN